jgi:hypothetical protein
LIRFVLRFAGLWILAAGFVALVRDGTKSIAGNALFKTSLNDDWINIHASSLDSVKALTEGRLGVQVWDLISAYILGVPTWLVLGVLGSFLILAGRRKKPLIGYGRD